VADIERAWKAEIEARVAAYERGEVQLVDAADVFAEARRLPR
jgi:exonuclease VII small subunit